jgi:N-carbamoyl-L-amino-acid hydrolase
MTDGRNLRIDGDRLWNSLMELAQIGATEKGGVNRQALTDLDREGRDLFVRWCEAAGCTVTVDRVGNIFARRAGREDDLAPVMMGSHLDTQPTGGKFDGAYGVLAGLEVIRALADADYVTRRPIEVSAWTNEEGCRFSPAMAGSAVFAGTIDEAALNETPDRDGLRFSDELARIGYAGPEPVGGREVAAFFEAHIEQGPILEAEERTIGIVTGSQALRWYDVTLTGKESHAGTTPMERRHDALVGAARIIDAINGIGEAHRPHGRATVGEIHSSPNSRNTIPGRVLFTVDIRHPEEAVLAEMAEAVAEAARAIADTVGLELSFEDAMGLPAVAFDADCVAAVADGAEALGLERMEIISGAGHDACNIAQVAPAAMIFVPCADGVSHAEIESATPEDCAAGCAVLLNAVLARADDA